MDLNSFIGVCADHLALHFERTANPLYLHIVRTRTLKPVRPPPRGSVEDALTQVRWKIRKERVLSVRQLCLASVRSLLTLMKDMGDG